MKIMGTDQQIPCWDRVSAWIEKHDKLRNFIVGVFFCYILFTAISFIGDAFRKVPLAFFVLFVLCPFFAWCLRSGLLDASLTDRGYTNLKGLLLGITVAIAFLFFAHDHFFRDYFGSRYLDGYSVQQFEDIDDGYGQRYMSTVASANGFSNNIILYVSQWLFYGLCVGIPYLTWRIAGKSINVARKRKMRLNKEESLMEIRQNLRQRYSIMETDELIELQRKGGLTEVAAGVLDEILKTRASWIRAEVTKQINETTPQSLEALVSQDIKVILKTKWLSFWTYFVLPIVGIYGIFMAFTFDYLFGLIGLIGAILATVNAWGLHYRKMWAWKLIWYPLLWGFAVNVVFVAWRVYLKLIYGYEGNFRLGTVIWSFIFTLIWTWLNYIYWKKRKNLFT